MSVKEGKLEHQATVKTPAGEIITRNIYQRFDKDSPLHDAENLEFLQPVTRYCKFKGSRWKVCKIPKRWNEEREAKWEILKKLEAYC